MSKDGSQSLEATLGGALSNVEPPGAFHSMQRSLKRRNIGLPVVISLHVSYTDIGGGTCKRMCCTIDIDKG